MVIERTLTREDLADILVVVVRSPDGMIVMEDKIPGLAKDSIQICLKDGDSLEWLNEKDMLRYGWVRATSSECKQ